MIILSIDIEVRGKSWKINDLVKLIIFILIVKNSISVSILLLLALNTSYILLLFCFA